MRDKLRVYGPPAIVFIAAAIALLVMAGQVSEARDQRDAATEREAALNTRLTTERARADRADDEADRAADKARRAIDEARDAAEEEYAERVAALDSREANLVQREERLVGLNASSFGDGIHQVGRDIQPGTYRTTNAGQCYYAKLGGDGEDILDNNNVDGPTTVVIGQNVGFFESKRCGTWTKIG